MKTNIYKGQPNKIVSRKNSILLTSILPDEIKINDFNFIARNKDHYFLQFNFSNNNIKVHQGFKIHISATSTNYSKILNIIFKFCKREKITFKYISNLKALIDNFSGRSPMWSAGKFITLYPDPKQFVEIIDKLYSLDVLRKEKGIYILTDRRYKDSNNIFYRYGVIDSENDDKYIYDLKGNRLYADYKDVKYKLPYFINEPFPQNYDDQSRSKYIYHKYFPLEVLNSKAAGSVYIVKSKENKKYI